MGVDGAKQSSGWEFVRNLGPIVPKVVWAREMRDLHHLFHDYFITPDRSVKDFSPLSGVRFGGATDKLPQHLVVGDNSHRLSISPDVRICLSPS
jgi:hypothetical protein